MKVENLRSLIRESINEYIREIDNAGNKAALEAKMTATQEAIDLRKKKMSMEGLDEAYHDMLDKGKVKELSGEVKALEKSLTKLKKQLDKLNSKSEPKTEVKDEVIDEVDKYNPENNWNDAEVDDPFNAGQTDHQPMDEARFEKGTDIGKKGKGFAKVAKAAGKEYGSEEAGKRVAGAVLKKVLNKEAEETTINESFLKMQKLAGVITEAQYNQKKSLIENENKKFIPAIEFPGGYHLNITDKMKQDIKNQLGIGDEDIKFGYEEDSQDRGAWFATIDVNLEALPADKKTSYKDIISRITKPAKTDDKTPPTNSPKTAKSGLLNKIKSAFSENQLNEDKIPFFFLKQVLTPFGTDRPKADQMADLKVNLLVLPKKSYRNESDIKAALGKVTKIEGDNVVIKKINGDEENHKKSDLIHLNDGSFNF
jgi:hypothetical protein